MFFHTCNALSLAASFLFIIISCIVTLYLLSFSSSCGALNFIDGVTSSSFSRRSDFNRNLFRNSVVGESFIFVILFNGKDKCSDVLFVAMIAFHLFNSCLVLSNPIIRLICDSESYNNYQSIIFSRNAKYFNKFY